MTTDGILDDTPGYADRVLGCLLGTMAGDAQGILRSAGRHSSAGVDDRRPVAVSDATQLTLYTVDGLVDALEWANDGVAADETACLWLAYLRWLLRQGRALPSNAPAPPPRWIDRQEDILPVADPDADTVRALLTGEMSTRSRPLNLQASGPGALMRSAPFGLIPRIPASMVERLTIDAATLTHGSAQVRRSAAIYSTVIRALAVEGAGLDAALATAAAGQVDAGNRVGTEPADDDGAHDDGRTAGHDGGTATASGTLAAALRAVAVGAAASPHARNQFDAAVAHAADGADPDGGGASPAIAASLAGGIVGALHGTDALPTGLLSASGVPAVVREMARSLVAATTGT